MGRVVTKLTKNLIIFRPYEDVEKPDDDYLFYVYDEHLDKIRNIISEDYLKEWGEKIITIKELYTNSIRKVASIITPVAKHPKAHVISYNTFGFFLLIKFSMDMIISYVYAKGLTKLAGNLAYDVNKEIFEVVHNLAIYFLKNFDYENKLESTVVKDLEDRQKFKEYYGIFYGKIKDIAKDNLTILNTKDVFDSFNSVFSPE